MALEHSYIINSENFLPYANEFDFDAPAERPLEARTERNSFLVFAFIQLICKGNLLLVVFRQKTDLS
jgi:hypothetical protein